MSVKNPLRNFGEAKTNRNNISPSFDSTSLTIQLTRIGKMLEDSILEIFNNFNRIRRNEKRIYRSSFFSR